MASARPSGNAGAGYSGTPLVKKLGIKPNHRVLTVHAPAGYRQMLAPLPDGVTFVKEASGSEDVIHAFVRRRAELAHLLARFRHTMAGTAALWVSWPKRASRVPTDVTEDVIRDVALPLGLVDVKVCAVDEVWSGLKLVVRREHRPPRGAARSRP